MNPAAVHVKICGITNWADARAAADVGAKFIGFNFYEKSPRCIEPAAAWSIRKKLPSSVGSIGIFVNWSAEAVSALSAALRLWAAQLHGDESPQEAAAVRLPVIKAFRVGSGFALSRLGAYSSFAFLLDGARRGRYGGTGQTADWAVAQKAARKRLIFLAGGLTPENVSEAIRTVRPYAVDVSSGVESRPGKKDHGKLREFFREVERASRDLAAESSRSARADAA